jgi:anaerobic magnesium-protoporphyrin IX monomethyl ester cyclase
MKVMIAYPPLEGKGSPMLTQNRQFQWFNVPSFIYPLVPAMAATLLHRDGFDVLWKDAITTRKPYDVFIKEVLQHQPDVIALETKTPVISQHWKIIDQLKEVIPSCKLVLFGDHVTALPQESLVRSSVDYVITGGDYDLALLALARHLRDRAPMPPGIWLRKNGSVANTGVFSLNQNLNSLPFIDRTLTKAERYGEKWKKRTPFFYTMAGRDCPWARCSFCAWTTMYPRFRARSPENLLDEIEYLVEQHGAREIFDDTGTFPGGRWLNKFCEGLIERDLHKAIIFSCNMRFDYLKQELVDLMNKAGFRKIKVGLESGNQRTLDRIDKGIQVNQIIEGCKMASSAGLDVHLTVMVGYPWETPEEVRKTVALSSELMAKGYAEMLQATVVIPYPGTGLHEESIKNNWFLIDPFDYDRYDMREPVLKVPGMEPEDIMAHCRELYRSFLKPAYVIRRIGAIRGWRDLGYLSRGAVAVFGHLIDFFNIQRKNLN